MPIPTDMTTTATDHDLMTLGLRATWLHLHLRGDAGFVLSPREREALTFVATSNGPVDEDALLYRLQRLGTSVPVGRRTLRRLNPDWLSARAVGPDVLYDLPTDDLAAIAARTGGAA